jgi:hypothetical protein
MNKDCYIARDLMPLYREQLLHEETDAWLKEHLSSCRECREMAELSDEPLEEAPIPSPIDNNKMFAKIHLKLAVFQIIFVAISFFFAMKTSLLNNSFGFILSYALLGFAAYLFYKKIFIAAVIAFLPNFIWSLFDSAGGGSPFFEMLLGAAFIACIHLIFALIGCVLAILLLKIWKEAKSE